jgi:hypothetical protein
VTSPHRPPILRCATSPRGTGRVHAVIAWAEQTQLRPGYPGGSRVPVVVPAAFGPDW